MRPDDGRMSLWPLAVIAFIVILAAASITPTVRLNTAPPPDFVALRASAKGPDADMAGGYWETAVSVIQWKYTRTSALPEEAPVEFRRADNSGKGANGESQAARLAYWARLREEWLKADNWHTTFSFDLSWAVRDAQSVSRAAMNFVRDHT
jgi:hypothetical protein